MNLIPTISLLVGYFLIICLSLITIGYIIKNRKDYGTELIAFLNVATILNSGIIYSTLFMFSVVFFISKGVNLILWNFSIISGFATLIITSVIYSFFREYRKIQLFPFLTITLLSGLLIGGLIIPDSVEISINGSFPYSFLVPDITLINYNFNLFIGLIIITFQISIALYLLYISTIINIKTKNKIDSLPLFINTFIYAIPILMYISYIIFREPIFRELYITLIWITNFGVDIMLIKKPEIFFILSNRIFSINIYHKSGILLYSYQFESEPNYQKDSAIWGNIIIGLNHILSEFVDKKDKIDVLQTKNSEIVVRYEDDYGYAVIIITTKKNAILESLMQNFSNEFKERYKNELDDLQDLNRIIDVAEFNDTYEIIERNFQLYL